MFFNDLWLSSKTLIVSKLVTDGSNSANPKIFSEGKLKNLRPDSNLKAAPFWEKSVKGN